MSYETMQTTFVRTLGALTPDERRHAGGKGAALARLYQAGYAVPDGFSWRACARPAPRCPLQCALPP